MERNQSPEEIVWQQDPEDPDLRSCHIGDLLSWVVTNKRKSWFYDRPNREFLLTREERLRAVAYTITEKAEEGWHLLPAQSAENKDLVFRITGQHRVVPYQEALEIAERILENGAERIFEN